MTATIEEIASHICNFCLGERIATMVADKASEIIGLRSPDDLGIDDDTDSLYYSTQTLVLIKALIKAADSQAYFKPKQEIKDEDGTRLIDHLDQGQRDFIRTVLTEGGKVDDLVTDYMNRLTEDEINNMLEAE